MEKKLSNPDNDKRISIKIDGANPGDVSIKLDTGENLGLIQSMKIEGRVGEYTTITLESILEEADINILQKQTELRVIKPPTYKFGYWLNKICYKLKI